MFANRRTLRNIWALTSRPYRRKRIGEAATGSAPRGGRVYEKYFVVDGHMHDGNAAPDNGCQGPSSSPRAGSNASAPTWGSGRAYGPRAASSAPLTGIHLGLGEEE